MTREDLKGIIDGITDEQLKSILDINTADIGKAKKSFEDLKKENETLKSEKEELNKKITEFNNNAASGEEYKRKLEELQKSIKEKEEADQKAKADAELTEAISKVFEGREFSSDYVKRGIIADMKAEIAKPENKGRGYSEIFEALTKDKEGIFKNPNPVDMTGMGDIDSGVSEADARAVMGLPPRNQQMQN